MSILNINSKNISQINDRSRNQSVTIIESKNPTMMRPTVLKKPTEQKIDYDNLNH
jgi:hypothetical protein